MLKLRKVHLSITTLIASTLAIPTNLVAQADISLWPQGNNQGHLHAQINPLKRRPKDAGSQVVLELFRRKGQDAGSRSVGFCPIAPSSASYVTWSMRPTLVWQGTVTKIRLQEEKGKSLWSRELKPGSNQQFFLYPTEARALEPGKSYDLIIEYEITAADGKRILDVEELSLEVLPEEVRQQIDRELQEIDWQTFGGLDNASASQSDPTSDTSSAQLPDALSPEDLAEKRAIFFAKKGLLLDAARESFSVSNSPSEWQQWQQQLRTEFCAPSKSSRP